ncbi:MAG: thioredoxin family protein [Pirellulaceae bacterium]
MVKTVSTMLPLGTTAPHFSLINVDGTNVSLDDYADAKGLLVMFICNHCPFVIHIADELASLASEYIPQGIAVVGINSNDPTKHPADSPEQMVHEAEQRGYSFAYLFDENQEAAKAYQAACTPDFFLFNTEKNLVYRGQLDGSRPGNDTPVDGVDLRDAMDRVLKGLPQAEEQTPSIGCNIKWIEGAEPEYFDPSGTG